MKNLAKMTAICAALLGTAALAEDASVSNRLDERGLTYEVDGDGDYKIIYNYSKEGRTQIVFVSGSTQTVGGLVVREVFAPSAKVQENNIDGNRALELLRRSSQYKLGSWELRQDVLYLVVKVIEPISARELEAVMDIAAESADDMEIELTGGGDDL